MSNIPFQQVQPVMKKVFQEYFQWSFYYMLDMVIGRENKIEINYLNMRPYFVCALWLNGQL